MEFHVRIVFFLCNNNNKFSPFFPLEMCTVIKEREKNVTERIFNEFNSQRDLSKKKKNKMCAVKYKSLLRIKKEGTETYISIKQSTAKAATL